MAAHCDVSSDRDILKQMLSSSTHLSTTVLCIMQSYLAQIYGKVSLKDINAWSFPYGCDL